MKTTISLSSDHDDLVAIFNGYELLGHTNVTGGVEYSFVMPKASASYTMAAADSLTKKVREKFGERRVGGTYITNIGGKTVFVLVLGTNLTVVR